MNLKLVKEIKEPKREKVLKENKIDFDKLATLVRPHYMALFTLYFKHNLTYKQISEIIGISTTQTQCVINKCFRFSRYNIRDKSNSAWKKTYKKYYDNAKINLIAYGFSSEYIDQLFTKVMTQQDIEEESYLKQEISRFKIIINRLNNNEYNLLLNDLTLENNFPDLNSQLIKKCNIYFSRRLKRTKFELNRL